MTNSSPTSSVPASAASFDYQRAFTRNIGWVTPEEQAQLRGKRIAIAGGGGVGGVHLLTLARLGVGAFHIADFDQFDLPNFNRQVGATMSTVGQPKVDVLARMALDISQRTFAKCAELGIPATTLAPLGMGAAMLNFMPGKMTFEEYFQWGDLADEDKAIRFVVGLAPAGLHRPYLVVPSSVNFKEKRGPSTFMACQLCAGIAATEALKILLGRGDVLAAPRGMQFDAYRNKLVRTWRPMGNRNPLHRLFIMIGKKQFAKMAEGK